MLVYNQQNWTPLKDGAEIIGSENGLGTILKDGTLSAGWLRDGVLDGYGFALVRVEREITVSRPKTYEEVMETASFDSCGRVIHCDGSPVTERRKTEEWEPVGTGLWKNGRLVQKAEIAFPDGLLIRETRSHYKYGRFDFSPIPTELSLHEASGDGFLSKYGVSLYVQPLPDGRTMLLERHGACFVLAPGEAFTFAHAPRRESYETFTYELYYDKQQ